MTGLTASQLTANKSDHPVHCTYAHQAFTGSLIHSPALQGQVGSAWQDTQPCKSAPQVESDGTSLQSVQIGEDQDAQGQEGGAGQGTESSNIKLCHRWIILRVTLVPGVALLLLAAPMVVLFASDAFDSNSSASRTI